MTCINWVRVRKGARVPVGLRLEIEQLSTIAASRLCVVGELVDFSLFVLFYCYFTWEAPTDLRSRKNRSWFFFFFPLSRRIAETAFPTVGVVSGAVEAAATTEPA